MKSFTYGWRDTPTRIQADGRDIHFAYDAAGRLASIREDGFALRVERGPKSEKIEVGPGDGLSVVNVFDAAGLLVDKRVVSARGETLLHYAFAYDRAGKLIGRRRFPGAAWAFHYGLRGELQQVERDGRVLEKFRYDRAHNRLASAAGDYRFEPGNRLVRSPFGTYTYDAAGRRIRHETTDGRSISYAYDEFGRMSRSVLADGTVIDFDYDWLWRRRAKLTNGATRHWIWVRRSACRAGPEGGVSIPVSSRRVSTYRVEDRGAGTTSSRTMRNPLDVVRVDDGVVWSAEPMVLTRKCPGTSLVGGFDYELPGRMSILKRRWSTTARYYDPTEGRFVTPDPWPATGANMPLLLQPAARLCRRDRIGAVRDEPNAMQYLRMSRKRSKKKPPAAMKGWAAVEGDGGC